MSSVTDVPPALELRITAGPLELRGITGDLVAPCELAERGLHDLVRGEHEHVVEGLDAFRRSIGPDPSDTREQT